MDDVNKIKKVEKPSKTNQKHLYFILYFIYRRFWQYNGVSINKIETICFLKNKIPIRYYLYIFFFARREYKE